MSTQNTTIKPTDGWVSVYAGPTTDPLSVEKNNGSSEAYLAISSATPDLKFGHSIKTGRLKGVVLKDGESLYIKCIDSLSPAAVNTFTITD